MYNPFLIGELIYLRPLEREDAPTIVPWFNDPEVTRFLLRHRPMSLRQEEQFIDHLQQSDTNIGLAIIRRDVDQMIGVTGLHQFNDKNRNAVFGISIGDKDAWGFGFGTEATVLLLRYAFETLNLHRIMLQVFEYNPRAMHIYEKLGFRKEGVLRQENYRDGRYWDTIVMGLLREEWEEMKR
jgi:UDP-4-amino-4,6-dideoxy-N-acetyl-beta-L-altrosamine N-acetyltransferase